MVLNRTMCPLSLRDTGYCHSDHKVSFPVHKVTLPIYSVSSLVSGYNKDRFMFTNLDWTPQGDRNSTSSTVLSCFGVNFQTIAISPMLIAKYIHTIAIYIYVYRWIYSCNFHSFELNNVRLETSAVYRIFLTQLHPSSCSQIIIISLFSPTREFTPGVLSSLEQTAWPRGEPGSSSDCMDGSVRLCCASMFLQAEHRALFTAVCPFLTLAPFFYVNRLFMARDRQTWLTSESIFQVIIWLA